MAKSIHRILAWILVLALCAGQLAIPVSASTEPDSSVTTPVEGGTQTVTVTVGSDGSQTTTTEVSTSDPETNTTSQSTTTEVVTSSGGQTSVDTTWSSTTTQTGSETEAGNPTVQTDTNVTTTVTGSENTTEITTTSSDGTQTTQGSNQGQETTTVTDTTVTTTTTTGVLFGDEDSSSTETIPTEDPDPVNTSTGWTEGAVTEGDWETGKVQEGSKLTTTESSSDTTAIDAANPGQATIHMNPDGKTVKVQVDVTIDQVLAGMEIPENAIEIKENGKVIGYRIVTTSETSTQDPHPNVGKTTESYGEVTQTPTAPEGYREGTVTDGNVTTVTEAIRDENDTIIGYRVTKTTVTENTETDTRESQQKTTIETTTGESSYTLPERPAESETTDPYGYITRTTVEDILEGDKVVGYRSTTTYYDPSGGTLRTETHSIYGTTASSSTQIRKDPETELETVTTTTTKTEVNEIYTTVSTRDVTLTTQRTSDITTTIVTEEDTYQLVETKDGLYFLYKGTMQPVVALSGHGDLDLTGLKPTTTPSSKNDLAGSTAITSPPKIVNPGDPGSDEFKYVDYGLISDFLITMADGYNTSEVHLYKLVDKDGNAFYAYCADMDTTAYRNTFYDISNANDVNYYQNNQDQQAHAHLLTIAINGYWGTSSGTGSMTAIKDLLDKAENRAYLKRCGYSDQQINSAIQSLTDGEAMTATQAAIWTFGNKSSSTLVNSGNPAANVSDSTSRRNIELLYDLLISETLKDATPNSDTDIITGEDIGGATLELKGQVTDEGGNVVTDSRNNEKYHADLTFTLKVEESALTGNLKVVVTDQYGNKLCDDIQLATENSNFLGNALADGSGYSYTIENLQIAEGVTINLNLNGYQNLKKGVYIYTAASGSHEDSQTFIGISEGTRDVNLKTSLTFTVEDPRLEHVDKSRTQIRKDTRVDRKEDHRTDTKTDTRKTADITVTVLTDTNLKTYGTETVTETRQEVTRESRSWESQWEHIVRPSAEDPEKPGGKKGRTLIPDALVPLAKAPKTGDLSALWLAISGLSLGGTVLLNKKRREEE